MLKIFLIIFCCLIIVIFFATKINHVKTWKEKNYEKLILEFGEPKILSELKGRHIVKTDLNQGSTDRSVRIGPRFSKLWWSCFGPVRVSASISCPVRTVLVVDLLFFWFMDPWFEPNQNICFRTLQRLTLKHTLIFIITIWWIV